MVLDVYKNSIDKYRLNIPIFVKRFVKLKLSNNFAFAKLYELYLKKIVGIKLSPLSIPRRITIELTNNCNSNCVMCPRDKMTRKTGFMDIELYKKIIDDCVRNNVKDVRLHNFGEPLLHPKFIEFVKIAKDKNLCTTVVTNGSLLNKKLSSKLIACSPDEIWLSIDSHSRNTYNQIRKGLDYDRLKKNLNALINLRNKNKLAKPKIFISHALLDLNSKKDFDKEWRHRVDGIIYVLYHDWSGCNSYGAEKRLKARWPCPFFWKKMVILWNGDTTFCCRDFNGRAVLGNVKTQSLKGIYLNEGYTQLRKLHLTQKYSSAPICNKCNTIVFY